MQRGKGENPMPPRKPRLHLPQKERRAQLLECAVQVGARRGLGRLTHAAIAKEAGTSVPTVFLYFPNREELVRAVIVEVDRFYTEQGRIHHQASLIPHDILANHLRAFADSIDTHRGHALIWLEWSTSAGKESGLWDRFLDYQNRMMRTLAETIRKSETPDWERPRGWVLDAARLIRASAYAITQLKLMGQRQSEIERFIQHSVDMALGSRPATRRGAPASRSPKPSAKRAL
jgi:TetR/AcrR family hemagglutinin/protease transcriptional regulator